MRFRDRSVWITEYSLKVPWSLLGMTSYMSRSDEPEPVAEAKEENCRGGSSESTTVRWQRAPDGEEEDCEAVVAELQAAAAREAV
jgi:hypothetical protein